MKRLVSSKTLIPIKVMVPGLLGVSLLTIERSIRSVFLQTEEVEPSIENSELHLIPESGPNWLFSLVCEGTRSLGDMIFKSYDNYFAFIFMMFLVNAFLHGFDILRHLSTKENSNSFVSHWKSFLVDQEPLKQTLRSLLRYSLIFCFYHMIWIGLWSGISLQALDEVSRSPLQNAGNLQFDVMLPNRILEQEEITSLAEVSLSDNVNIRKKPSLSIGKILGQIDVFAGSIKLSKDEDIAFVTTSFPFTLQIIRISDPEDPFVLSTFSLPRLSSDYISKTILISPDETKLFISSIAYLQVIDINNLYSPSLIAHVDDPNLLKASSTYRIFGFAKPNLIMSRDQKFLFVSGYGLQIFDISVPTAPRLIHSVISQINSGMITPASIALSDDGKKLYYSDGGLWIYNVEDPEKMKVINSFNITYPITSMILSNDAKTAFVLGQDQESNILMQKLYISEISSIKEGQITLFNQSSICQPIFLERTPDNLFMMILFMDENHEAFNGVLIFDTQRERLLSSKKLLVKHPLCVVFDDYQRVLVGNGLGKLEIVDLYLDYPNKHAFAESNNTIQTFAAEFDFFSFSKNERLVYSTDNDRLDSTNFFGIHQMTWNFSTISGLEVPDSIIQMVISQDNKRVFLLSAQKIVIVDISNPENVTKLGEYNMVQEEFRINFLGLSRNGKTGFLTLSEKKETLLEILDLSDPQEISKKGSVQVGKMAKFATSILSNDERTLFIITNKLLVYSVSDPSNQGCWQLPFFGEEYYLFDTVISGILSPDGKTIFVRDESSARNIKVSLIDVSNISSPRIESDFRFPIFELAPAYVAEKFFWVSADSKTLYIARPDSLMVLDVSNLASPKYLGSIKVLDDSSEGYVIDFSISADGRKAYVKTNGGKLHLVSIDPVYTTFIKQDALMLGERYSIDLQALKMNGYMDYENLEADYRFVKFALVEGRTIQNNVDFEKIVMKTAPSWMNFDLKTQTLSVEARRQNDIGSYKIYFAFSTQIEMDAFSVINGTLKSEDLVATLVALGYLNNQRFLTEDFGELKDFILPSEYSGIKEEIYGILKRHLFGTFNEISVIESLVMSEKQRLKISTRSLANLKVQISLDGEAQFLSRHYGSLVPMISRDKSQLVLEGSLRDLNAALREIVINLPQKVISCDGEIIIDDKLNPVMMVDVKNISRLLNRNKPPGLNDQWNITIQDQIDKESLKTGQYFQIKLSQKTFSDRYTQVEDLNYQLVFIKGKNETNVLPGWLSFSDMTLMGTAPEEILDRDFEFKLVVKNEFQEFRVPFTLHVNISSSFVLKLLMKYSPYILSVVGLLISANKIFNIICKSTYKHPKNFYLRIGQEVTSEVIFPVAFIREETQEAKKILRLIEKKIGAVGSRSKNEFLSYFMRDGNIDKLKVLAIIKESLNELTYQEKKTFSLYLEGHEEEFHPRRLVNQVIINTLTNDLLKSNEERETKGYFEKIKGKWPLFVEWDLLNSSFKIHDDKFNKLFQKDNLTESTLTNDMENGLLDNIKVNIDLLKDAILAYAFECQNIDAQPVFTQLNVKEKIKTNFLKRFLKLDLGESPYREKGKIGFGIGYSREYSTLCFNGIVKSDMRNKTIVIQITDLKHKILRELWLFGGNEQEGSEGFLDEKSEIEAKGKDYEIF